MLPQQEELLYVFNWAQASAVGTAKLQEELA